MTDFEKTYPELQPPADRRWTQARALLTAAARAADGRPATLPEAELPRLPS